MSSYFFHLKLELYQTPAASAFKRRKKHHSSEKERTSTNPAPFLPSNGTDIFRAHLPAHRISKWTSYSFSKRRPSSGGGSDTPLKSDGSDSPHHLSSENERKDSHGGALLLPERSSNLKSSKATSISPRIAPTTKHTNAAAAEDWRYDSVEIESIDMDKSSKLNGHTKALYLPSEPKTTELGWGVVHLYRDSEESYAQDGSQMLQHSSAQAQITASGGRFSIDDCSTLCILAVPSWMMPSDLLGFVGDQAREDVSHFRLIRTGRANKYMVLLKFRSPKKARDWQKAYNGRLFSAAEPENCHVVFIKSVEFITPDDNSLPTFQQNHNDPFTTNVASKGMLSKPMAPPPPNLLELPTCPVCLERMDETTGLLTILCQHVFHCACLEKWRGGGCPVCRYTHAPSYTFPYPRPGSEQEDEREAMCASCAGTNNLWICLICGNIGCGRYDEAHAFAHYEETSHCYAMDISTQHVWDYAGDGLIQSKPPPTPAPREESSHAGYVDMPLRQRHENEAYRAEGGDVVPREKMENMAAEYTYLLTSQLEGQRKYFEEQIERAVDKATKASHKAEEAASSASKVQAQLSEAISKATEAREKVEGMEKALAKSEATKSRFEQMARDMTCKFQSEKSMNDGLMKRIKAAEEATAEAKQEVERLKEEKQELQDMNHDLSMFISSQEKVKELQAQGEEVEDGHAYAPEAAKGKGKGKGKGRKK
ncbi:hypothetical protein AC579_3220 [Pseudocercospora musae]|uniref:RING-type domain-containing protein n=1 Tax=Pseudocercospora musae TaxID=113226 RepID=A0A139ISG2_9PEZI|nr:hypothetical protein AC579_3220 [Pseudocercospora musae]